VIPFIEGPSFKIKIKKEIFDMSMMRKSFSLMVVTGLVVAGMIGCGGDSPSVTMPDTSNFSVEPMAPPPGFSGAGGGGNSAPAAQSIQAAPSD